MANGEKRIYNADLLEAIHELDKKLVSHLGLITEQGRKIGEVCDDIYNHGEEGGIQFKTKTMWAERKERKGMLSKVKVAVIISIVNGLMTAWNLFNII